MKKTTVALLLTLSFFTLLGTISLTKVWLDSINIPVGKSCIFSKEAQNDPTTRRVCLKNGCILYSKWIKMSDKERASARGEQG